MKYTTEIKVNVPLDEFIKKMDNVDNMKHWQRGLVSAEHISGDLGQLGAKMKLNYKFGKLIISSCRMADCLQQELVIRVIDITCVRRGKYRGTSYLYKYIRECTYPMINSVVSIF